MVPLKQVIFIVLLILRRVLQLTHGPFTVCTAARLLDYDLFCTRCFIEYTLIPSTQKDTCTHCNGTLITREERHADLKAKVEEMKREKQLRREKREWFKRRAAETRGSDGKKNVPLAASVWDWFEIDSEEDEDVSMPDDPQFKAMEMDIQRREKERLKKKKEAEVLKEAGNTLFASKQYKQALEKYNAAVDLIRDEKAYYLNRALCHLLLYDYSAAVKDCNTALDIWEYFEKDRKGKNDPKNHKQIYKAFLRRATAYKGLQEFDRALQDVNSAKQLFDDLEANKLLLSIQQAQREYEQTQQVVQSIKAAKETATSTTPEASVTEHAAEAATAAAVSNSDQPSATSTAANDFNTTDADRIVSSLNALRTVNDQLKEHLHAPIDHTTAQQHLTTLLALLENNPSNQRKCCTLCSIPLLALPLLAAMCILCFTLVSALCMCRFLLLQAGLWSVSDSVYSYAFSTIRSQLLLQDQPMVPLARM